MTAMTELILKQKEDEHCIQTGGGGAAGSGEGQGLLPSALGF